MIGKLNYLSQLTQPDIQISVQSCAWFKSHANHDFGKAVEYIAGYLEKTSDNSIKLHPQFVKGFIMYANADFSSSWLKEYAKFDPITARSKSCNVTTFANSPFNGLSSCKQRYS